MDLKRALTPAVMSYEGLQYQHMARGEMVRFLAEKNITDLEYIKEFHELGFSFSKKHSNEKKYVFVKDEVSAFS